MYVNQFYVSQFTSIILWASVYYILKWPIQFSDSLLNPTCLDVSVSK